MKVVNVKVPKASKITHSFTAGENITANQIVMIDSSAVNTVLIASTVERSMIVGVALNDALLGAIVEVCIFGVVEVIAGENLSAGDIIIVGATAGRAYKQTSGVSGAGAAHTHAENLTVDAPVGSIADAVYNCTFADDFCADDSGGAVTKGFYSVQAKSVTGVSTSTHSHGLSGAITDESTHAHSVPHARVLGKMLESATLGNAGKILVCLA